MHNEYNGTSSQLGLNALPSSNKKPPPISKNTHMSKNPPAKSKKNSPSNNTTKKPNKNPPILIKQAKDKTPKPVLFSDKNSTLLDYGKNAILVLTPPPSQSLPSRRSFVKPPPLFKQPTVERLDCVLEASEEERAFGNMKKINKWDKEEW
jgi:hypothetical protein